MSNKILEKLYKSKYPKDFTIRELDSLMSRFGVIREDNRGRIKYRHPETRDVVIIHAHNTGVTLKKYNVDDVKAFLEEQGLVKN